MTLRNLILVLTGLVLVAGCGGDKSSEQQGPPPLNVIATTGQVGDLVANIGRSRVAVTTLMGPGVDPHLYKASAGDVERLREADIIFYNGLHLESKMAEVLEGLGARQPTAALAEAVPEAELLAPAEFEGAHDPHVWFDPNLWRHAVTAAATELARIDPDHADHYAHNAAQYLGRLQRVHEWAVEQVASVPEAQRVLVTAHDAFNYFGRAYGLEVRGLQGISTAAEAGTGDVQDLATFIAQREIPAIFVESSVSPRAIEAVREAVQAKGFQVVVGGEIFSDALGDQGTPEGTYLGMLRHNVRTITAALRGEGAHE
jgi:manganese/zinc/iron transport system substrate-binding protein